MNPGIRVYGRRGVEAEGGGSGPGTQQIHLRDGVLEVAGKKLCGAWGVESDIWWTGGASKLPWPM